MTLLRIERCVAGARFGAGGECRFGSTSFDSPPDLPFPAAASPGGPGRCPRAH
jgi:hypothetical protein